MVHIGIRWLTEATNRRYNQLNRKNDVTSHFGSSSQNYTASLSFKIVNSFLPFKKFGIILKMDTLRLLFFVFHRQASHGAEINKHSFEQKFMKLLLSSIEVEQPCFFKCAIYCLYIAHKYEKKQLNIIGFRKRFVAERCCDRGNFKPLGEKAFIGYISMRKTVEPCNFDALQIRTNGV